MRITEKHPAFLTGKIAAAISKRRFGKVIAPLRSIFALQPSLLSIAIKMDQVQKKLSLDEKISRLIPAFVSTLNNCSFCSDIDKHMAQRAGVDDQKLNAITHYQDSPMFSDAEKAAMSFCEEVTFTKNCSDKTFTELRKYFSEKEWWRLPG